MHQKDIARFYDGFLERLLHDFAVGNPRVLRGIRLAIEYLPFHAERILDIGCGIGWSTLELSRHFPHAEILGIDISSNLIRAADKLFDRPQVNFMVGDVSKENWSEGLGRGGWDAAVMIDVFEHLPITARLEFCHKLSYLLLDGGYLILAYPSPAHLAWDGLHAPDLLQPEDHPIGLNDLQMVVNVIGGVIVHHSYISVWDKYDYVHTVIRKGSIPFKQIPMGRCPRINTLNDWERAWYIANAYPGKTKQLLRRLIASQLISPWKNK